MFGKETDAVPPAADARGTSILAQGCKFKGEVVASGTLRVEGELEGKINKPESLVIGKTGIIRGDVEVKNAIVGGHVYGNIIAENKIELQGGSHVEGDIKTRRLVIDEGVYFEGNCSMGADATKKTSSQHTSPTDAERKQTQTAQAGSSNQR